MNLQPIKRTKITRNLLKCFMGFILFVFSYHISFAQNARQTLYLELGGNAVFGSVNYDLLLSKPNKKIGYGLRVGFGGIPEDSSTQEESFFSATGAPLEGYLLIGKHNHKLDLGAGVYLTSTMIPNDKDRFAVDPFVNAGYRYQRATGGFFFKIGVVMQKLWIHNINHESLWRPWAKIGVGYTFKG